MFILTAFAFSMSFSLFAQGKSEGTKQRLALVGGQIYPDPFSRPISDGVVLIENGKITAVGKKGRVHVPPDVETVDSAGKTIVAGFWNSHVHFTEPKWQNAADLTAAQLTAQLQEMYVDALWLHLSCRYGFASFQYSGHS
jgi:cytosine/adenosine deaminase-related metal-dependent hydrolase